MAEDYGLKRICDAHEIVIVDNSTLTIKGAHGMDRDNYERIKSVIGEFHLDPGTGVQINYISLLESLFRDMERFFVTEKLAGEYRKYDLLLRGKIYDVPKRRVCRKLMRRLCRFAYENRMLEFGEEENRHMQRLCRYFDRISSRFEEKDLDIILSGVNAATYRGPTAVLSNDTKQIGAFKTVSSRLNAEGYMRRCLKPVSHRFAIYTLLGYTEFHEAGLFEPSSPVVGVF